MTEVKLGFLGCGDWANRKYIPYILSRDDVEVVAVSNLIYPNEREKIRQLFQNVTFFDTHEDLCSEVKIDGAIVALPHAFHCSAARSAVSRGIPTLVDKPLGVAYSQAKELVDLASVKKVTVAVSSQRRTQDGNAYLRQLVQEGKLGAISWIQSEFVHGSSPHWEYTWRNDPKLCGIPERKQGVLLDTGYHLVDSILHILGNEFPNQVYAEASFRGRRVDSDAVGVLNFPSGTRATVFASRLVPPGYDVERITLLGSNGYGYIEKLECAGEKSSRFFFSSNGRPGESRDVSRSSALDPFIDFINHLKGAKMPGVWEAQTTLATLKVIDALYTSLETHSPVILSEEQYAK